MSETQNKKKVWDKLSDGCIHEELIFGSGDFYIICAKCNRVWEIKEGSRSNIGRAANLSGEIRVKPNDSNS